MPSATSAREKPTSTWTEVSCEDTTVDNHLRLTRSMMINTAISAAMKWVVSYIQTCRGR